MYLLLKTQLKIIVLEKIILKDDTNANKRYKNPNIAGSGDLMEPGSKCPFLSIL